MFSVRPKLHIFYLNPSEENENCHGVVKSGLCEAEKFEVGVSVVVLQQVVQLVVHDDVAIRAEAYAAERDLKIKYDILTVL